MLNPHTHSFSTEGNTEPVVCFVQHFEQYRFCYISLIFLNDQIIVKIKAVFWVDFLLGLSLLKGILTRLRCPEVNTEVFKD